MSHLDEGTLHALLDGELELNEVREIQAHLGSCSACGTRLQSVKDVLAESDRLVATLQFPGTPRRPAALDLEEPAGQAVLSVGPDAEPVAEAHAPAAAGAAAAGARRPERGFAPQPIYDEPPPVLLVPDDTGWAERRRRVALGMRWAALVLVAVGAGYLASEARRTARVPVVAPAPRAAMPAGDSAPTAVLSDEEATEVGPAGASGAAGAVGTGGAAPQGAPSVARVPAPEPARKAAATPPAPREPERPSPPPAEERQTEEPATDSREDYAVAADEEMGEEAPPPDADVRTEAAQALAELDRQRRRERAAAATAALDSAAIRRPASVRNAATGGGSPNAAATPAPTPAPPPAPRTLEQRSGIYLRIGLDEAARQLGRPVHVLEGMQPQFMGLAQGSASPGADGARPVVRVVYQDNQGRMILLDQQRIRPGQTWGSAETRWVIGEIGVALLGEPGPEILRNLRPRVR